MINAVLVLQTCALLSMLITSCIFFFTAKSAFMKLNNAALFVGSSLALWSDLTGFIGDENFKLVYQAGITIIIIISVGVLVSLQHTEKLWITRK
ncbi:MAG: hypothetical protein DSY80_08935 [Desulfocapsa sp.]|nr:MAG: hypothetical protein DSY80_08935 [Desulfocapsa sp.]